MIEVPRKDPTTFRRPNWLPPETKPLKDNHRQSNTAKDQGGSGKPLSDIFMSAEITVEAMGGHRWRLVFQSFPSFHEKTNLKICGLGFVDKAIFFAAENQLFIWHSAHAIKRR